LAHEVTVELKHSGRGSGWPQPGHRRVPIAFRPVFTVGGSAKLTLGWDCRPEEERITDFAVSETWHGRVVVLVATGTIDTTTAPALYGAAAVAVQKKPDGFVFDFTGVDLLTSDGIQVLITTMRMLGPDVGYAVAADGPGTSRPLDMAGVTDHIALYPTLADALDGVADGQQ
jgi:anti-anti-sigma factor